MGSPGRLLCPTPRAWSARDEDRHRRLRVWALILVLVTGGSLVRLQGADASPVPIPLLVETHRGSESVLHALPAGSTLADLADRLGTKLSLPCASGQALLSGSAWDFSEGDCPSSRPPTDPLLLGAPVDPNLADRSVLESLPGVGPTLAGAILERRDRVGPFRDLEDLDHVRGIGPSTLRRLAPYLKIDESLLPPRAPALPSEAPSVRGSRRTFRPVDLNRANQRALQSLPGIGPAKARAILEDRERRGPFERVEDLARVRGIGPATLKRIAPRAFVSDRSSP